jgi:hypothetical protein
MPVTIQNGRPSCRCRFFHQCVPFQPGHTGPDDVTGMSLGKNRSIEQEDFAFLTSQEKYRRRTGATSVYNDRFVHATSPQRAAKPGQKRSCR